MSTQMSSHTEIPKSEPLRVFIGCDPRQPVTYNVMQFSITRHSTKPVQVTPLYINQLPITRQGLTPFTYTRFLVPWLCDYKGWALFTDADMLVKGDLVELFSHADDRYDVMVVKNPEQFEWASVILFNCDKCTALTPDYVQNTPSDNLFQMKWGAEVKIGGLPSEWNHLVGYSPRRNDAKLIHYTQGSPMFPEIGNCEYSGEWLQEHLLVNSFRTWQEIMGPSVHAAWLSGEQVPKLALNDKIMEAQRHVTESPEIVQPKIGEPYSRKNPSVSYQQRVKKFLLRHVKGDQDTQQSIFEIDPGTNMLQLFPLLQQFFNGKDVSSLLDYGAGKTMQYSPIRLSTKDGDTHVMFKQFFNLKEIACYDPGYPLISVLPEDRFDCVLCVDVLDRCPEEDVRWIVAEVMGLARSCVFIKVNSWDNGVRLIGGEPEVCLVKTKEWWIDLLASARNVQPGLHVAAILQTDAQGNLEDLTSLLN